MMKCGKSCKCTSCKKKGKKRGSKIPTPKAKGQKGNVKSQSMRKRSAY